MFVLDVPPVDPHMMPWVVFWFRCIQLTPPAVLTCPHAVAQLPYTRRKPLPYRKLAVPLPDPVFRAGKRSAAGAPATPALQADSESQAPSWRQWIAKLTPSRLTRGSYATQAVGSEPIARGSSSPPENPDAPGSEGASADLDSSQPELNPMTNAAASQGPGAIRAGKRDPPSAKAGPRSNAPAPSPPATDTLKLSSKSTPRENTQREANTHPEASTAAPAAERPHGGYLRHLFWYNTAVLVLTLLLSLAACLMQSETWRVLGSLYWIRVIYGLLAFPFVVFKFPLAMRLFVCPAVTGYDEHGRVAMSIGSRRDPVAASS